MPDPNCPTCKGLGGYPKCPTCHNARPTDTPETEAHPSRWQHGASAEFIHADFARKLDRERNEARHHAHAAELLSLSAEHERDRYRAALEAIEERFIDGIDTYDAWKAMGELARAALALGLPNPQ